MSRGFSWGKVEKLSTSVFQSEIVQELLDYVYTRPLGFAGVNTKTAFGFPTVYTHQ